MAVSGSTGFAEAIGIFKDAWDETGVVEAYRNKAPLLADAKLSEGTEVGGVFHVATRLTYEGGQSWAPPQTQPGDTSTVPYVGATVGETPDAKVEGYQVFGRSRVTYEAIARSCQSVSDTAPNKKKAVREVTQVVAGGLMEGTVKKCEALMLHGRRGLGQLDTAVDVSNVVATTYKSVSGYAVDVSIRPEAWSAAIWMAFEGHTFDLFADSSGPSGSRLNTALNTELKGAGQYGFILIAVNPPTPLTNGTASGRVLRLWHTSGTAGVNGTGVIGGWTTAADGAAAEHICFEGGGPANEWIGLTNISRNAGTLFNISALTFGMWRGNFRDSVGNIRLAGLIRYLAEPINAGAQGTTIRAVVPTELFSQFANDEATLRRYAAATGNAENGFDNIKMYLPHQSMLEILGHGLQKDGEILCYVPSETIRVGSQDLDFVQRNGSGSRKDRLILEVADRPASELRLYGQFSPYAYVPRHMLHLSGVTY